MNPMRLSLLTILLATAAGAEAQRPKLAVHPLVVEGVDSKKDREDLVALLPGMIIAVGKVEIASPSDVDAELKKKGQAFCSPENLYKCLSYIADHTSSAHAIRIELRRGGRPNEWEILAAVVCVDGSVQRQPEVFVFTQSDQVKFLPIARTKLEQFIATLNLSALPVSPPARPAAAVEPAPKSDVPFVVTVPPLPPPETRMTRMRKASFVTAGGAVAAFAVGGIVALLASADASQLTVKNGGIPRNQLSLAQGIDGKSNTATVFFVIGGLAAGTAFTLFLLSDANETVISPAPIPDGAGVVFSSRF